MRDGNGNYQLPPGNPVVTGTVVSSTDFNSTMADIRDAITQSISKDGQTTPTQDLPMGGRRHTNCSAGTARTHYATLSNLQDDATRHMGTVTSTDGNALVGTTTPTFTALVEGQIFTFRKDSKNNTAAVTLSINGIDGKALLDQKGGGLSSGNLPANCFCIAQFTNSAFVLLNTPTGLLASSVLNADTLDGVDSTQFARRDRGETFAADVGFSGNVFFAAGKDVMVPSVGYGDNSNRAANTNHVLSALDARLGTINNVPIMMHTNTAPPGWVRSPGAFHTDKFIRLNNSSNMTSGGVAGVSSWATVHTEGADYSAWPHTLTIAEMPSHDHDGTELLGNVAGAGGLYRAPSGNIGGGYKTGQSGGGGAHSHTTDFRVAWVDMTLCQKT